MITAPWWLGRVGLQFPPGDRRRRMPLVDIPLPTPQQLAGLAEAITGEELPR